MRTPTRISNVLIKRGGRLTRPLLVAALAAGLVVAGSSAAQAQSITDVDTAGDMVIFDWETEETRPAPNQVRNDVLRTTLTHSATRISIRVKYAELQRVGYGLGQSVQMVTNEGVRRNLDVIVEQGHWAGWVEMCAREGRRRSAVRGPALDRLHAQRDRRQLPATVCQQPPMGEVPCRRSQVRGIWRSTLTTPCVTSRSSARTLLNPAGSTERANFAAA